MNDPLHTQSPPGILWSRANTAEATPGVLTPMCWSYYGELTEVALRQGMADLGVLPQSAVAWADSPADRLMAVFHGRSTLNVGTLRRMMMGLPGVTGDDIERDVVGTVREGVVDDPYPGRTLAFAVKAPPRMLLGRNDFARLRADVQAWWSANVGRAGVEPGVDPRELLGESRRRFAEAIRAQGRTRLYFQGATSALADLAETADMPETAPALLAVSVGIEEAEVADELWLVARGQLTLDAFIARHGFHGPNVGSLATRSWREDAAPLERLLDSLRDAEPPAERRRRVQAEGARTAAEVLRALPPLRRPAARAILRLAPYGARALHRTKTSFLVAQDAGRAAVRAIGAELVSAGRLEHPEDGFYLMAEELLAPRRDFRELVAERRDMRDRHAAVEVPETWVGQPEVRPINEGGRSVEPVSVVTGLGVGPGVAEGTVRVVHDAADEVTLELGDILVCPITDPSWVSLMTVAGALVIDIGGLASHGAVVARELGVPCVIGTRTGTRDLRDGDRVRVDGARGRVEILQRST